MKINKNQKKNYQLINSEMELVVPEIPENNQQILKYK